MPLFACPNCGQFMTKSEGHVCSKPQSKTETFASSPAPAPAEIAPKARDAEALAKAAAQLVQEFFNEIGSESDVRKHYEKYCIYSAETVHWCAGILDESLKSAGVAANATSRMNSFLVLGLFLASRKSKVGNHL